MSTAVLERRPRRRTSEPVVEQDAPPPEDLQREAAQTIFNEFGAVSVTFHWMGTRKSLTKAQKGRVAAGFDADETYVGANKKLFDTGDEKFKAVTNVKSRVRDLWTKMTLPYVEDGVRLIRLEHIDAFNDVMRGMQAELTAAVTDLSHRYDHIRSEARVRLGALFNEDDYPEDLSECFGFSWSFPTLSPPDYLQFLNPAIFQAEVTKFHQRVESAVSLAEAAFVEEFGKLVSHLAERLTGSEDGKPKVFRDSAIDGLAEFFERFRMLNLRSNPELDALVSRAKGIVEGKDAEALRQPGRLRNDVATALSGIGTQLETLTVEKGRRRVMTPAEREKLGF